MADRGTPLPFAIREELLRLAREGHSHTSIARELGIHRHTVRNWAGKKRRQVCTDSLPTSAPIP